MQFKISCSDIHQGQTKKGLKANFHKCTYKCLQVLWKSSINPSVAHERPTYNLICFLQWPSCIVGNVGTRFWEGIHWSSTGLITAGLKTKTESIQQSFSYSSHSPSSKPTNLQTQHITDVKQQEHSFVSAEMCFLTDEYRIMSWNHHWFIH